MVQDVAQLSGDDTYRSLQSLLLTMPRLRAFPIVDRRDKCILLGSVTRRHLAKVLNDHVGPGARTAEARSRRRRVQGARRPSIIDAATFSPVNHTIIRESSPSSASTSPRKFTVQRIVEDAVADAPPKKLSVEEVDHVAIEVLETVRLCRCCEQCNRGR